MPYAMPLRKRSAHDREHVTPFIRQHPERFTLEYPCPHGDLSDWHWSVDHPQDLLLIEDILREVGIDASLPRLRLLLNEKPDLAQRSTNTMPNEGAVATFQQALRAQWPLPSISRSNEWWERGKSVIPAGTQTLSKGPSQFCEGVGPKYLTRGEGCTVWDVDGNAFIDYPMALGPITLGHGHPAVVEAVEQQLRQGSAYSCNAPA